MLRYCSATDKGGRENNEDAFATICLERDRYYLFAVADGLGGHAAGEVASALAIAVLSETVKKEIGVLEITPESMKDLLAKGFRKANEDVLHQAVNGRYGMGTTLVAALLNDEGRGVVVNAGDSRAYLAGDKIIKITKDHSYVQELVDRGMITQDEAAVHPEKNIVTRIIGMEGVEPDFYEIELGENALLLCSDGLTDALSDEEIREVIISSKIESMCKNLVEAAKPISRDNITVVAATRKLVLRT